MQKFFWFQGGKAPDFFQAIFESQNLKRENEESRLKIQELLAENTYFKELKEENDNLREALGLDFKKDFKLVLADVLGKDIGQDVILVSRGSKDGISEGLSVITSQKVVLGKISEVYENFSKVRLISSKESSFGVEIQGSEISGAAKGEGGFNIILDLIPRDKEIKEGDVLVTAPLGGDYKRGLLVGTVKDVIKSDLKPFQQAKISPFFNVGKLINVFIILNDY